MKVENVVRRAVRGEAASLIAEHNNFDPKMDEKIYACP